MRQERLKQIFSMLLIFAMLITMLPVDMFAEENGIITGGESHDGGNAKDTNIPRFDEMGMVTA